MNIAVPRPLVRIGRTSLRSLALASLLLAPSLAFAAKKPVRIGAMRGSARPTVVPFALPTSLTTGAVLTLARPFTLDITAATSLSSAVATGASLTKSGAGTLTLSGSTIHTGGTLSIGSSFTNYNPTGLVLSGSIRLIGSSAGSTTTFGASGMTISTIGGGLLTTSPGLITAPLYTAVTGGVITGPSGNVTFTGGSSLSANLVTTSGGTITLAGGTPSTIPSSGLLAGAANISPIPEPSTALLGLLGLSLLAPRRFRRR